MEAERFFVIVSASLFKVNSGIYNFIKYVAHQIHNHYEAGKNNCAAHYEGIITACNAVYKGSAYAGNCEKLLHNQRTCNYVGKHWGRSM